MANNNFKESAVNFVNVFFIIADEVKKDPTRFANGEGSIRKSIDDKYDLVRTPAKWEIRKHLTNVKLKSVVANGQLALGKLIERYLELIV